MNRKIQTTELDFDLIKSNLKTFLQGQTEFSDYNFEGSGLSILLDILAMNTHYNALYTNLAINESFIDSASKRSSVVSKAYELGYTPRSSTAATATISIVMINNLIGAPATITIPARSEFTTVVDNTTYSFYTLEDVTGVKNGNQYVIDNVVIREGVPLTYTYQYTQGLQIIVPNTKVDRSTIRVSVQENINSTNREIFSESTTILNVGPSSPVYFLKELEDQTYQLEFGDGNLGKALEPGNIITVEYFVCNESEPNGATSFSYTGSISGTAVYVVATAAAADGSAPEDIESIRWNAPKAYTAQNRCVTVEDYKSTIMSLYSPARSVNVWGGEDNVPPVYGKVFVSIIPESNDILTDSEKNYILTNIINPRKPLTVTPVIVDPTYLNLVLNVTFYYNQQQTTRSVGDIQTLVRQVIQDYNGQTLNEFGSMFKYSKLVGQIDSAETSITGNIVTLKIKRDVTPIYNVAAEYSVNIDNPIYEAPAADESILSTGFIPIDTTETCYIDDSPNGDGTGTLRMFYIVSNNVKVIVKNIGTVKYSDGIINITDLNITSLVNTAFTFTIKPKSNDIVSLRNDFITIDMANIVINGVAESNYSSYQFTSSRN